MSQPPITCRPIGLIHSPFKQAQGTPIQGVFSPSAEGIVEVFEPFVAGLRDVELFSHIYLLYVFHRAHPAGLTVIPYLDDQERGVFAVRAPARPNPIGLSVVRLLSRDDRRLHVADLDVLDGAPLLDIKPYVPQFDCRPSASSGWLAKHLADRTAPSADGRFES
jgi:tRNA-Thr(GGU) m(6)t(6)A37 methyltransferase TsaA